MKSILKRSKQTFSKGYFDHSSILSGAILILFAASCQSSSIEEESPKTPSTTMGTKFESPIEYAAGENPTTIVAGDWDNDGLSDLIVLSPRKQSGTTTVADGTLTQFIDNTSVGGNFPFTSSSLTPASAVWRQHLIAADIDGDNYDDLVTTATNLDEILILLNDSGTFSDNESTGVGDEPVHLATIDFDDDSYLDLSVVNRKANTVSILRNDSGSFTDNTTLSVGSTPLRSVSGDWDNDSDTDLAILASSDNSIEIWLNDSGSFSKYSIQPEDTGDSPRDLIQGDWNCDGYLDLASANFSDNTLSLYYGQSSGPVFSSPITITTGYGPVSLATADFNSDTLMDFIVSHRFSFTTSSLSRMTGDFGLILSQSTQSNGQVNYADIELFASIDDQEGSPPADVLILDVDNDSLLDVLLSLPLHQKLALLSGKSYSGQLDCS